MQLTTDKAIAAIIAADSSISEVDAQAALALLRGQGERRFDCGDVLLSRGEAADLLRVNPVTVTRWADEGRIRRVRLEGRRKSQGYSRNSIVALIEGRAA